MLLYAQLPRLKLWLWLAVPRGKTSLLCIPPLVLSQGSDPHHRLHCRSSLQTPGFPLMSLTCHYQSCTASPLCHVPVARVGTWTHHALTPCPLGPKHCFSCCYPRTHATSMSCPWDLITSASRIDQESNPAADLSTVAVVDPCSRTKELCQYLILGPRLCRCSRAPLCQICN